MLALVDSRSAPVRPLSAGDVAKAAAMLAINGLLDRVAATSPPPAPRCRECGAEVLTHRRPGTCLSCQISEVAELDVRLLPYLRVLGTDYCAAQSIALRRLALCAAHMGADLARRDADGVDRVDYDDARMQWVVTMHPRPIGYPWCCVLRLNDEDVEAWAETHGLASESAVCDPEVSVP